MIISIYKLIYLDEIHAHVQYDDCNKYNPRDLLYNNRIRIY